MHPRYMSGILLVISIAHCLAVPLSGLVNSDGSREPSLETNDPAASVNKRSVALARGTESKPEVDRDVTIFNDEPRRRRSLHDDSHAQHTMQHILDQVEKGHVTSSSMSHWMAQLEAMYNDGLIDSEDLRNFIDQMHASLAHTEFAGACCPFGK